MGLYRNSRQKVYRLLEASGRKGSASWWVDFFIMVLIMLNVIAIVIETVPWVQRNYLDELIWFDLASVGIFTVEYFLRIWSCVENPKYSKSVSGRLRWMMTPLAIIDLLAIVPFYLLFLKLDLRFIRALRLLRLFRLFKIARYIGALRAIHSVLRDKKEELVLSLIFMGILLLFAASLMYYVEYNAQPGVFTSIPHALWWAVATLTTVGYGDMYPVTPLGQFLGGIIAIVCVGLFALPTGILAGGFMEALGNEKSKKELRKTRKKLKKLSHCPHCGERII